MKVVEEVDFYRRAAGRIEHEVCQVLGRALGYPWYKDDQENFPGASEEDGVCVGEHTAASLADEAADRIRCLSDESTSRIADAVCDRMRDRLGFNPVSVIEVNRVPSVGFMYFSAEVVDGPRKGTSVNCTYSAHQALGMLVGELNRLGEGNPVPISVRYKF